MKKLIMFLAFSLLLTGKAIAADDDSVNNIDNSNITVVTREESSGTRGAFLDLFGIRSKITKRALVANSVTSLLSIIKINKLAIGYIAFGSLNDDLKVLSIDNVKPSAVSIANGDYTITRPYNVVVDNNASELAKDFINFMLSVDGQKIVTAAKFFPVKTQQYTKSTKSGKIVVAGSKSVTPIMEQFKIAYITLHPDVDIEIITTNSSQGFKSIVEGTADIGMVSRSLDEAELKYDFNTNIVAIDGVALVVHKSNPTENLTKKQIQDIYTGEKITW